MGPDKFDRIAHESLIVPPGQIDGGHSQVGRTSVQPYPRGTHEFDPEPLLRSGTAAGSIRLACP